LRPTPLDHTQQAVRRCGGGHADAIIQVHAWIMPQSLRLPQRTPAPTGATDLLVI
jgi:hypothetical protein